MIIVINDLSYFTQLPESELSGLKDFSD